MHAMPFDMRVLRQAQVTAHRSVIRCRDDYGRYCSRVSPNGTVSLSASVYRR